MHQLPPHVYPKHAWTWSDDHEILFVFPLHEAHKGMFRLPGSFNAADIAIASYPRDSVLMVGYTENPEEL